MRPLSNFTQPGDIFRCLESIFPFHGLLLLNQIPPGSPSPTSTLDTSVKHLSFNSSHVSNNSSSNNAQPPSPSSFFLGGDDAASDASDDTQSEYRWQQQVFQQQLAQQHHALVMSSEQYEAEKIYGDYLPFGVSPAFYRLLRVVAPTKSILQLAADSDLTVNMVFQV